MKKKIVSWISSILLITCWMGFSLSCGASTPAPEPKSTITLEDINSILKNQEVNILVNNGLTSEQLMEVTKLCIQTGELEKVVIAEENAKLSYAVLNAQILLNKIPMIVKFSYSISKNGTLKMRIVNLSEVDSDNSPYIVTVYTKDYNATIEGIKTKVFNSIEMIGNTVLTRSADFA